MCHLSELFLRAKPYYIAINTDYIGLAFNLVTFSGLGLYLEN